MKAKAPFYIFLIIAALLVTASNPLSADENREADQGGSVEIVSPMGYYLRGIIPGWGQYYGGYKQKGLIFLGSFAVTGGIFTWSLFNMMEKKQAYRDIPFGADQAVFDKKWKAYRQAGIAALALGLLFGAVYTASWVDLIFFSDYTGKKKGAGKRAHRVYFEGYQEMCLLPYRDGSYGIKLVYTF